MKNKSNKTRQNTEGVCFFYYLKNWRIVHYFLPIMMSLFSIASQAQECGLIVSDVINPLRASTTVYYRQDLSSKFGMGTFVGFQSNSLLPTPLQLNKKKLLF
jgi:hypothetical protein